MTPQQENFEIGIRVTWEDLYMIRGKTEGFPFGICSYTGIVQHITKNDIVIDIEDPYFSRGERVEIGKALLAHRISDENLRQQIIDSIPQVSGKYTIYGLVDPRSPSIFRYIGVTDTPKRRYKEHLACLGTNQAKNTWVQELLVQGIQPEMIVLETPKGAKKAYERERYWIQYYLEQHAPLTNIKGEVVS
jgi:predicted GIY-YIG superfamily endonuclease